MERNFGRKAVAVFVIAAVAGAGGVAAYAATKPATGGYQISDVVLTSQRKAGKNTIITALGKIALTGDVTGDGVIQERSVVHRNGSSTDHGVWTCSSCTLGGKTGQIVTRFEGKTNPAGVGRGHFTFKGDGDLKGVRGHGTYQDGQQPGSPGTYTGKYHSNG
jgi:hypothetical protein